MKNLHLKYTAVVLLSFVVVRADTQAQNKIAPGEFVIENPDADQPGIRMADSRRRQSQRESGCPYRKQGETAWKEGLPLLRLQGERIYQTAGRVRCDFTQHVCREHSGSCSRILPMKRVS